MAYMILSPILSENLSEKEQNASNEPCEKRIKNSLISVRTRDFMHRHVGICPIMSAALLIDEPECTLEKNAYRLFSGLCLVSVVFVHITLGSMLSLFGVHA